MSQWIGPVFLMIGFVLAGVGVIALVGHRRFMGRAEVTDGEIRGYVEERRGADGNNIRYPIVRFHTPDGTVEQRAKVGTSWNRGKIGSRVEIYYLRDDPARFKLKTIANVLLAIIPIVMGVIFMGIGAALSRAFM